MNFEGVSCGNTVVCYLSTFLNKKQININYIHTLISGGIFQQLKNNPNLILNYLQHNMHDYVEKNDIYFRTSIKKMADFFFKFCKYSCTYSANSKINTLEKQLFIHDKSESLPRIFFCSLSWSLEKMDLKKIDKYNHLNGEKSKKLSEKSKNLSEQNKNLCGDYFQNNNKNSFYGYRIDNDDHNSHPNNWGYCFADHELIIIKREKKNNNNNNDDKNDNNRNYDHNNNDNYDYNNINTKHLSKNIIIEYDYQIIQGYIQSETENGYNLAEWQNSKNEFASKTGISKKKIHFFLEKLKVFLNNETFDCINHKEMFNVYSKESKNEKYFPCFSYREFDDHFIEGFGERPLIDKLMNMIKAD
jgi:hypothetical protein